MVSRSDKLIEKDFKKLLDTFPKLNTKAINQANSAWLISGEMDICDTNGDYWETFEIKIVVPFTYPHCVISVLETSGKIERSDNRHINEIGFCCLDIDHKLQAMKLKGVNLLEFTKNKIYSFFANQIYFDQTEQYAAGDYRHHFNGVRQFYQEDLKISSDEEAIQILEYIFSKQKLGRNDQCFCGTKKFKECHLNQVDFLKSVGKEQLKKDLAGFKNEL